MGKDIEELKNRLKKTLPADIKEDGCYGTDGSHEELMGVFERAYDKAEVVAMDAINLIAALEQRVKALEAEISKLRAENERLRELYSELLNQVGNKYPNETRHETALRYIQNAEKATDNRTYKALGGGA